MVCTLFPSAPGADDVEARIEGYLVDHFAPQLRAMSPEVFAAVREELATSKLEKPKTLVELAGTYYAEITVPAPVFDRDE